MINFWIDILLSIINQFISKRKYGNKYSGTIWWWPPRTATTYCPVRNARKVVLVTINEKSYDMFWAKTTFLIFWQGSRWDLPGEVINRYPHKFYHRFLVFYTKIHHLTYCFRILSLTGNPIGAAFRRQEDLPPPPALCNPGQNIWNKQHYFAFFQKNMSSGGAPGC